MKQIKRIPIGPLLLTGVILISRFLPESNFMNFLEGLLTGLSIVLSFSYIRSLSKKNVQIQ